MTRSVTRTNWFFFSPVLFEVSTGRPLCQVQGAQERRGGGGEEPGRPRGSTKRGQALGLAREVAGAGGLEPSRPQAAPTLGGMEHSPFPGCSAPLACSHLPIRLLAHPQTPTQRLLR